METVMRHGPNVTGFVDRREAGSALAPLLAHDRNEEPVVLGIPRGGVAVAFEVARALHAPLDAVVVRKLGVPFQRELAMGAIGGWYEHFEATSDDEVRSLLAAATPSLPSDEVSPPLRRKTAVDAEVIVSTDGLELEGDLRVPTDAIGLVIFAHGSGSSRLSPRNRLVAENLNQRGLATLLFDLLTPEEAVERANVFDIELLAVRLLMATRWARRQPACRGLEIGYFGASTGGGAALWAAAEDPSVRAVVSRGGRPDLAGSRLAAVEAPTLLIVGGADPVVRKLNQDAAQQLRCVHELAVVPGATHLFEEPGTLERAARLAGDWFLTHLADTICGEIR
jgi:putative phosphoribosyl transferase